MPDPLGMFEPDAEDFLGPIRQNAKRDIHSLVADKVLIAEVHPHDRGNKPGADSKRRPDQIYASTRRALHDKKTMQAGASHEDERAIPLGGLWPCAPLRK